VRCFSLCQLWLRDQQFLQFTSRPPSDMAARSSCFSKGSGSAVSSACSGLHVAAISDRAVARPILPGRRRLMREEDSSGNESEGEGGDSGLLTSSVSHLRVPGARRYAPGGNRECSSGCPKRVCVLPSSPVPAPSGPRLDAGSGAPNSSPNVLHVRTERASLSQTLLTSWLVRKV